MANLLDLARRLEKRAKTLDKAASDQAERVAIAIVAELAVATPVDTSTALSNWQVSLNAPAAAPIPPYVRGEYGSTQSASISATIDAAKRVLSQRQPGDRIFISNVLPYIGRLNEGYSKQAPAGFVERAVLVARNTIRNRRNGR